MLTNPLDDLRRKRGLTVAQLAEQLGEGFSVASTWRYCRPLDDKRRRIPDPDQMARIHTWSDGEIEPNRFYNLPAGKAA